MADKYIHNIYAGVEITEKEPLSDSTELKQFEVILKGQEPEGVNDLQIELDENYWDQETEMSDADKKWVERYKEMKKLSQEVIDDPLKYKVKK